MAVPTCLPTLLHGSQPAFPARLFQHPLVHRRDPGGVRLPDRPAWQSPYGPPPHRAHRGRWATKPAAPASPGSVLWRGHLCGRCD
ncbi:MAG: hypothetical protein HOY69_08600 [Streptomyces sp.]|nr:hypothetical protein [Streptomyces sp.]